MKMEGEEGDRRGLERTGSIINGREKRRGG
jgi:hypothetical protein